MTAPSQCVHRDMNAGGAYAYLTDVCAATVCTGFVLHSAHSLLCDDSRGTSKRSVLLGAPTVSTPDVGDNCRPTVDNGRGGGGRGEGGVGRERIRSGQGWGKNLDVLDLAEYQLYLTASVTVGVCVIGAVHFVLAYLLCLVYVFSFVISSVVLPHLHVLSQSSEPATE
eukprot:gene3728-4649_t